MGWDALSVLPREELHRVSDELLRKHYRSEPREGARDEACLTARAL